MSIDFYDPRLTGPGGLFSEGSNWSPGVPCGRFWLPPMVEMARERNLVAQFEVPAEYLLPTDGPEMCWLTSAGAPREHLVFELLADEMLLYGARGDWLPQGLVACRGELVASPDYCPKHSMIARVHYCGPEAAGKVSVRPVVLFTRRIEV